ncbi:MAG: nucleotidyltransferase family protein [Candidatus Omnitrophica bacterium]|nr:nucleotidyltransferase family protein [Candidatus Omnitrophota bacterium]
MGVRILEIKNILESHKKSLAEKYHVSQIGIFGSHVRDEQSDTSDIDILVDFSSPISLFEFISLEEELSILLKAKVDLVSRKALKPYIGESILKEVQLV